MKICKDCGIEKDLIEFHKNGTSFRSRCKKCHNFKFQPPTGKINIGRFKKGSVPSNPFKKGNESWNKGLFKSENRESRKYKLIREIALKRDKYTCMKCNATENLHVHHIKPWKIYPELRLVLENLITICNSCHGKEDLDLRQVGERGYQKGHKQSPEILAKIAAAKKGKPSWNAGKKLTEEHKTKLAKAKIGYVPWNKGKKSEIPNQKICKTCKIEKEMFEFTPQERGRYYSGQCKKCRNEKLRTKESLS